MIFTTNLKTNLKRKSGALKQTTIFEHIHFFCLKGPLAPDTDSTFKTGLPSAQQKLAHVQSWPAQAAAASTSFTLCWISFSMGLQMLQIEKSVWHRVYKALLIHKQMEDFGGVFWQEARGCALTCSARNEQEVATVAHSQLKWIAALVCRCIQQMLGSSKAPWLHLSKRNAALLKG